MLQGVSDGYKDLCLPQEMLLLCMCLQLSASNCKSEVDTIHRTCPNVGRARTTSAWSAGAPPRQQAVYCSAARAAQTVPPPEDSHCCRAFTCNVLFNASLCTILQTKIYPACNATTELCDA